MVLFHPVDHKRNDDPNKALVPVSQLAGCQLCMVSGPRTGAKTMAELVAKAKADPTSASFGSSGNGTVPHFLGLMIGEATGIDVQHGPFQGGDPAMSAVLGGYIG